MAVKLKAKKRRNIGRQYNIEHAKLISKAIGRERKRLYDVLETLPVMVCLLTRDYHVAYSNRYFREKFGESNGRHCYEFCCGKAGPCEFCESYTVFKTGKPHRWEFYLEGSVIDTYDFPFSDIDGTQMILEMGIDVTKWRRAEEALRDSEANLEMDLADTRKLQRISSSMIKGGNVDGLYDQIIDAARSLMHSDMSSLQMFVPERGALFLLAQQGFAPVSAKFWEWVQADDTTSCGIALKNNEQIIVPDVEIGEFVFGTEDLKHYRLSGIRSLLSLPLHSRNGRIVGVISTHWREVHKPSERELRLFDVLARQAADLIERDMAEKALQVSEERFRTLNETTPVGVSVSTGGTLTYTNPAYEHILGYEHGELLGKKASDLYVDPLDRTMWVKLMIEKGSLQNFETKWRKKDGTKICVSINVSPVFFGDKDGVICTMEDITERKRAEKELNDAKLQAELYLDLMGHDINNLHQIALGYLELAREMMPHSDLDRTDLLDRPIDVLNRSSLLIQNVRKLQKLNEGRFQAMNIDVYKLLKDIQHDFGALPNKSITFDLKECDHCHVCANELLHDVFSNLVSNAIKHSGAKADICLHLDIVNEDRRYCRVIVDDNGPGIQDDLKKNIFNRGLKNSKGAKGMGLGLYLVKTLVDNYKGRVWVEDRIKGDHTKGARFVVMLPAIK